MVPLPMMVPGGSELTIVVQVLRFIFENPRSLAGGINANCPRVRLVFASDGSVKWTPVDWRWK